jgi:hypothetical protein
MTTQQDEFFQTHAQDGVLTPEHAAQFLELVQGDTSTPLEIGSAPTAAPVVEQSTLAVQGTDPDPANTVILAKDGIHTIGYEKLVEAREGEKHWKAQAEAQAAELDALKAAALARADAGQAPTQADNVVAAAAAAIEQGVDPAIFGDYSEEALAKGIRQLVAEQAEALRAEMRGELAKAVQPLKATQAVDATAAHMDAIYAKHPDADSMHESQELKDWIGRQPSFARAGYESVLQKGSTAEIIEFFDTFKAATGKTQAADPKAAARALIAQMDAPVPASLSDIPGGRAGASNPYEALDRMAGPALADAMESMSSSQREAYLNRQM